MDFWRSLFIYSTIRHATRAPDDVPQTTGILDRIVRLIFDGCAAWVLLVSGYAALKALFEGSCGGALVFLWMGSVTSNFLRRLR